MSAADQPLLRRKEYHSGQENDPLSVFDSDPYFCNLHGRRVYRKDTSRYFVWSFRRCQCRCRPIPAVFPCTYAVLGVCPHHNFLFLCHGKECVFVYFGLCGTDFYTAPFAASAAKTPARRCLARGSACTDNHLCDCADRKESCGKMLNCQYYLSPLGTMKLL